MKKLTDEQIKYRVIADTLSTFGLEEEKDGKEAILIFYKDRFKMQDLIVMQLKKKGLL